MITWILLAGRPGALSTKRSQISGVAPTAVFFEPHRSGSLESDDGHRVLLWWERDVAATGTASRSSEQAGAVSLISGHAWSPTSGVHLDVARLAQHPGSLEAWRGIFCVVRLDRAGSGLVTPDPFGIHPVYTSDFPGGVAFSSRASLAAWAAAPRGATPSRDRLSVAWMVAFDQLFGAGTGFADVRAVPSGSWIELDAGGMVHRHGRRGPVTPEPGDRPGAALDAAVAELGANIEAMLRLPGPKTVELTGGRDSRLVLALLLAAGAERDLYYRTVGGRDEPDVVAAAGLAQHYGLHHRVDAAPGSGRDAGWVLERIRRHLYRTCFGLPPFQARGETDVQPAQGISGLFGELLRCYYGCHRPIRTAADVNAVVRNRFLRWEQGGLLLPDAERLLHDEFGRTTGELMDGGTAPGDVFHRIYLEHRMRRWVGSAAEINGFAPRLFPLQSPAALRAAMAMGEDGRRAQSVHRQIVQRLAPGLEDLPWSGKSWLDESTAPRLQPGLPPGPAGADISGHRSLLATYLLDDPTNPVFDVVSRPRVQALLDEWPPSEAGTVRQAYNLLGGALWMRHGESTARVGEGVG